MAATTLEQTQVKLPRSAHPFAYVFDKKDAPLAAAAACRSEDYWEVDPGLGAVVRHHVYPRKRLYVPTPEDAKEFPNMSSHRRHKSPHPRSNRTGGRAGRISQLLSEALMISRP